jgi:hypothetical protein
MRIDSAHHIPLVILATAWGPKFGGINAFNEELTRSLGIMPDRAYELICVVPRATDAEVAEAARSCWVRLVAFGDVKKDGELHAEMAAHVLGALGLATQHLSRTVWLGRDDESGLLEINGDQKHRDSDRAASRLRLGGGVIQSFKKYIVFWAPKACQFPPNRALSWRRSDFSFAIRIWPPLALALEA